MRINIFLSRQTKCAVLSLASYILESLGVTEQSGAQKQKLNSHLCDDTQAGSGPIYSRPGPGDASTALRLYRAARQVLLSSSCRVSERASVGHNLADFILYPANVGLIDALCCCWTKNSRRHVPVARVRSTFRPLLLLTRWNRLLSNTAYGIPGQGAADDFTKSAEAQNWCDRFDMVYRGR
eukprot:2995867-Pleurochrysis_carterae.AAC.1